MTGEPNENVNQNSSRSSSLRITRDYHYSGHTEFTWHASSWQSLGQHISCWLDGVQLCRINHQRRWASRFIRGAGQSEFLTVYGGLELALGIAFLWPLYRPAEVTLPLLLCLLIHGCLVAFRTAGFVLYSGIPPTTFALAATEWIIFIGAAILYWRK